MSQSSNNNEGGLRRRDFLKIVGVTTTTAAVMGGCSYETVDRLIPYVNPPEDLVPGMPKFYASTCRACPAGCGILVKNREGRAIKIEGNPSSPINKGTLCARGQALPQELYNPDRLRGPAVRNGDGRMEPKSWADAEAALAARIEEAVAKGKPGNIVFLTTHVSGTFASLLNEWLDAVGGRLVTYEPISYAPLLEANRITFGIARIPTYRLDEADFLVSFGADYLETWLSPTQYQYRYAEMHSVRGEGHGVFKGKSVHVEARLSLTGANADKWIKVRPGTEGFLALGIANAVIEKGFARTSPDERYRISRLVAPYTPERVAEICDVPAETVTSLARSLGEASRPLAVGGGAAYTTTAATDAMVAVNLLNYLLGAVGERVDFSAAQTVGEAGSYAEMAELIESMRKGEVDVLLVHDANPAYSLPAEAGFAEAVANVPYVASFSSFRDETSAHAHALLPDHTTLEKWDDYVPQDGVRALVQPAVVPVFNTKQTADVLLSVAGRVSRLKGRFSVQTYYDNLRNTWRALQARWAPGVDFESFWQDAVRRGGLYYDPPPVRVSLSSRLDRFTFREPEFKGDGPLYLVAYPSSRLYDGRGANKPWLQELPDALTTAVWDSWLEIHPDTARSLGVKEGDFVKVTSPQGSLEVQVFVTEGIRPDTVAVALGQGHTSYGRYAKGRGVNPVAILPAATDARSGAYAWLSARVELAPTGRSAQLVKTQYSFSQEDRAIAQALYLTEDGYRQDGHEGGSHGEGEYAGFYPRRKYVQHRWGMAIDLDKCVGCGACVVACYAENNVPFVGKRQIAKRREMSWIRIERYYEKGQDGELELRFIPMTCQQCENAPCEPVCPVFATYTNPEGLNAMVYPRCVGTRYCSNNCTYKVRRFNWLKFDLPEPLNWQLNPDVTVRSVGVMEKCTFCVQRIMYQKNVAKEEGRTVRDGEIETACQQTCPSKAIVFGDINDPETVVSKVSEDARGYKVLEEVNAQPAISYLKKVKWDKV